jgi:hypothetical protein
VYTRNRDVLLEHRRDPRDGDVLPGHLYNPVTEMLSYGIGVILVRIFTFRAPLGSS